MIHIQSRIILAITAFFFNIIDYITTYYCIFLNNNNYETIVNPLIINYSNYRYGNYHYSSLIELKLIIFTFFMIYSFNRNLIEFRLLIYNLSIIILLLNNFYIIYLLRLLKN